MTRDQRYDDQLNELEMAVKASQMTLSGALARAFILGMNYQTECNQESAENAAEGARIETRERE